MPSYSIQIRVTPRANKSEIVGRLDDILLIRVAATPVDGAANKAVIKLISEKLGIPKTSITIESGAHSRVKRLTIEAHTSDDVWSRLESQPQSEVE